MLCLVRMFQIEALGAPGVNYVVSRSGNYAYRDPTQGRGLSKKLLGPRRGGLKPQDFYRPISHVVTKLAQETRVISQYPTW